MASLCFFRHAVSYTALSVGLASCSIGGLVTSFSLDTSDKSAPVLTSNDELEKQHSVAQLTKQKIEAVDNTNRTGTLTIDELIAQSDLSSGTSIDSNLGLDAKKPGIEKSSIATPALMKENAFASITPSAHLSNSVDPGVDPIKTASLLPLVNPGVGLDALSSPKQQKRIPGLMPLDERQCRSKLNELNVRFSDVTEITKAGHCGIDYPIKLEGLSGGISVSPNVTINCQTALAFAQWTRDDVAPAVRVRYLTGLKSIETMGGYSCRRMNAAKKTNAWSEHSTGNAIDISGLTLKNGRKIDVSSKSILAFREKGLLKSIRAASCDYFNTTLGPGYPKHDDHIHLDLMQRASGKKYCR